MTGSRHNTPSTCPLSTFEARVQWATKKREVYTYDDTVELNVNVPKIEFDDNDDDIEDIQRKYERRYQFKKKERKNREEENIEMEKELRELLKKYPALRLQTTEGNSNSGPPQLKRRREVDTPVRPMKVARFVEKQTFGNEYDVPCERCKEKGIPCHEQNPAKTCCFECRKRKMGCSFVSTAKGIPRAVNHKKSPLSSNNSEDEYYPSPAGFRRSVRNPGSAYSPTDLYKLTTVLESINTTIRDGFDNLQKTLEKLDDGNHLDLTASKNITNHEKRQHTPGSSPVY